MYNLLLWSIVQKYYKLGAKQGSLPDMDKEHGTGKDVPSLYILLEERW
jgi:hypothetical protein